MYVCSLHYIEMPSTINNNDPAWKIFNVYCHDSQGSNPSVQWVAKPEPIVMLAMKNPHIVVAKDINGITYTGEQLLNIIIKCKTNDYSMIGQWI